ncbi:putative ferric-chelate reductase 1 [Gastrophryne carolinensis]
MTPVAGALVLWLLAYCSAPANGYPNGKVTAACNSMIPQHKKAPQTEIIHNITVDKTAFKPGDRIKVTLSGPRFDGFFIQARDADQLDSSAVGSFSLINEEISQLLTCGGVQHSAVSQTNKRRKELVEVYWIAPSNAPKRLRFLVTVVEKYAIYWVKIPGPVVSRADTQPGIVKQSMSPNPPAMPPKMMLSTRFSSSGCGSTKFCVRHPAACDPERDINCFFLSFHRQGSNVLIEMSGPGSGYISFALSHDQWMGDDDTYLCVINGQSVDVNPAYTTGRSPPDVGPSEILQNVTWRVADGVLQCSFRRSIFVPSSLERFPLDDHYYIFLADGDAVDGNIYKHKRQPLITSKMFNVIGSPEDVGGSRSPILIKFHGALMFLAWMTTVSIGVIVARFFKPVWPDSTLCGEKIWFQVHRILMITTLVLTAIAFVLPFLYRHKWSNRAGYHPYLGCTVMALAILQPVMAIFRPPTNSPRRRIFNWTHWGGGTAARIIAVAAIFLGMDLQALDLPDPWDTYTMVGFVLWHVCTDILLELHSFCLLRRGLRCPPRDKDECSINSYIGELKDSFNATKLAVCKSSDIVKAEDEIDILHESNVKEEGHTFKKIVLTIYVCGNFAFLITFLAAINQL